MALATQLIFALIAAGIALYYSGRSKILIDSVDKAIFGSYGCVPAANIEELTLQYFKTRGRAESIRMILQDNNIPYSEVNFNKDEWLEIKKAGIKTGIFTFGQGKTYLAGWVVRKSYYICLQPKYTILIGQFSHQM